MCPHSRSNPPGVAFEACPRLAAASSLAAHGRVPMRLRRVIPAARREGSGFACPEGEMPARLRAAPPAGEARQAPRDVADLVPVRARCPAGPLLPRPPAAIWLQRGWDRRVDLPPHGCPDSLDDVVDGCMVTDRLLEEGVRRPLISSHHIHATGDETFAHHVTRDALCGGQIDGALRAVLGERVQNHGEEPRGRHGRLGAAAVQRVEEALVGVQEEVPDSPVLLPEPLHLVLDVLLDHSDDARGARPPEVVDAGADPLGLQPAHRSAWAADRVDHRDARVQEVPGADGRAGPPRERRELRAHRR
eukprot:CAMPEP_0179280792 /NCGR_PEP_ID=MMETSP0797-20121207/36810_1 /TAXON_ID=47934 /ORGANISM="Dinophysis acuminata, Strain DAEP01" /LENGTH=303 /DNA_ID=CAMNT_0020989459 /DNA_START=75 /DNA_END=983 /DNA_ORIENTATION=+